MEKVKRLSSVIGSNLLKRRQEFPPDTQNSVGGKEVTPNNTESVMESSEAQLTISTPVSFFRLTDLFIVSSKDSQLKTALPME